MSGGTGSGPLAPTFHGFVQNSMDGLLLFEACLSGKLHHVPRRPHDRERSSLIKSGNVFIYEENASGIKRWTDGVAWSPSRILGNFLIYRELEKPFPPGEKKRAMKRKRSSQLDGQTGRRESEDTDASELNMPPTPPSPKPAPDVTAEGGVTDNEREVERQLIGSLVDSYGFRPDGLVKKTMSVAINGVSHHLVSYYKVDDVKNRVLGRPIHDSRLQQMSVRPDLYLKQNFRTPVEETEHYVVDPHNMHAHPGMQFNPMAVGPYGMRPPQYMAPSPHGYQMYGMPSSSAGMYAGAPATAWATGPSQAPPSSYPNHSYTPQTYQSNDYYSRPPSSTPQIPGMKTEEHNAGPTSYSYPNTYQPGRPSSGSFSQPHSSYQSPMRPPSTSYAPSSQPQGSSPNPARPTSVQTYSGTPTQSHSFESKLPGQYTSQAAPQPYGVPSVTPASASQPAKSPAVGGGPMPSMHPGDHTQMNSPISYRQPNYSGHEPGSASDAGGLGISSGYHTQPGPHPVQYQGGSYANYSQQPPQGYRTGAEGNTAVPNAGHY